MGHGAWTRGLGYKRTQVNSQNSFLSGGRVRVRVRVGVRIRVRVKGKGKG
jgi:hypothetical protein